MYEIEFDDFSFSINPDVASVAARTPGVNAAYTSVGGSTLLVHLTNSDANAVQAPLTIIVRDQVG